MNERRSIPRRKETINYWLKRSLGVLLALCLLVSTATMALAAGKSQLEDCWQVTPYCTSWIRAGFCATRTGAIIPTTASPVPNSSSSSNRGCGLTVRDAEAAKTITVTAPATYCLYAPLPMRSIGTARSYMLPTIPPPLRKPISLASMTDAVTRAASNHGLHCGSYQKNVTIHTLSPARITILCTEPILTAL